MAGSGREEFRQFARAASRLPALVWAFPATAVGLLFLALALLTGGRARVVGGALEADGGAIATMLTRGPLAGARIAAVTLGHVILAPTRPLLDESRAHERAHVRQCERWGPFFLPAYAAAGAWVWLHGGNPYWDNWFERTAMADEKSATVSDEGEKPVADGKTEA